MSFAAPPALDFELLFALLPAPHGVLAPDGTVLHLNAAMVALLPADSAPNALIGQPLAALRAAAGAGGALLAANAAWGPALAAALGGTAQVLVPAPVPAGPAPACGYWQATLQPIPPERAQYVLLRLLDVTPQLHSQQVAEQERFRFLAESLPQLIWTTNEQGQVDYTNQRFIAYTGHDVLQMAEADKIALWQQVIHPADLAGMYARWGEALHGTQPFELEFRLRGVDGEYRWFLSQVVAQRGAAGQVQRWFGLCTDVDARHRAQLQVGAQQRHMERILDQLPLTITAMEAPDFRFTFLSARARQLMGPRVDIGTIVAESLPEITDQSYLELLQQVVTTGQPVLGYEKHSILTDPTTGAPRERYNNFGYLPLTGEPGAAPGVLAYSLDVTEQVQARQRSEALRAETRTADQRLRRMTASLPFITFISDQTGQVLHLSPQWYAYTGTRPADDLAQAWAACLHPDDAARVAAGYAAALAAGAPWRYELRLRRHDGEYRWFMSHGVPEPLADAVGRIRQWFGSDLDIHDLHERTAELTRSRTDFATLADNMAQLAWMADATGYIFWYNQQWHDYTGSTLADMKGWGWQAVHDPALVAGINARYLASIRAGQPWEDTFPLRRHDGGYRWFLSRARPIRDTATGEVVRWFGTNTDVTELRDLQTQLAASEEEQRIQAESIPQQVWTAQPDGTVDFYNHRMAAYLGEAMEKNGAAHWLNFVHPDDRALMQERWLTATASQRYYEAEFRLRRYDGQYRWFLGQAQARRAPGGHVLKWYGTNTDVHQQRVLQEQVLASQARFKQFLETLPQLAWTARPDGGVNYYNQGWYTLTGASFAELRDWGWERFMHPDDFVETTRRWQYSLRTGEPFTTEHRWRDQQGHYRWFLARAEAIRDTHGEIVLWVGTNTDVHDFKQAQHQLETQNARLRRTNEDLDNFIYTASHDLKQPIHNMAGIFEELTRTAYFRDPDAIKLISYFERALARIYGTIDDLSAIVQVQRQQQEMPMEAVNLSQLVDEILASLHDQITQTGAMFELDFATCPVVTFVRPNLQSVLFNLLSNSLKYAAPNRPPRIRLSSTPDTLTGLPVLTVQDNGLGIDLDRFGPQLFQLFRRFHTHVDGTGMGLYLVNRIVQNHGGRLEVSSKVDEGTTFQLYL